MRGDDQHQSNHLIDGTNVISTAVLAIERPALEEEVSRRSFMGLLAGVLVVLMYE